MIKTTISGVNQVKDELNKIIKKLDAPIVLVGIHEDASDPDKGEINMATLGAVHEFGADIDHPGGTDYGYNSKDAASKGQVRFLKKGAGYMVLGQTKPHKIKIPARPWLQPGFDIGLDGYLQIMADGIDETMSKNVSIKKSLKKVGVFAVGVVQEFMTNLKSPPNTTATVRRKKGKDNPLIDSGAMRGSINYKLSTGKPEEGI